MENFLEETGVLREQAAKAASYLRRLVRQGDYDAAKTDLFGLGALGQLVVLELTKQLTKAEREKLSVHMTQEATTDTPRLRARRTLKLLADLGGEPAK